jgi:hypothetical protein
MVSLVGGPRALSPLLSGVVLCVWVRGWGGGPSPAPPGPAPPLPSLGRCAAPPHPPGRIPARARPCPIWSFSSIAAARRSPVATTPHERGEPTPHTQRGRPATPTQRQGRAAHPRSGGPGITGPQQRAAPQQETPTTTKPGGEGATTCTTTKPTARHIEEIASGKGFVSLFTKGEPGSSRWQPGGATLAPLS